MSGTAWPGPAHHRLPHQAWLLVACLPGLGIAAVTVVALHEMGDASARLDATLQTIVMMRQVEDLTDGSLHNLHAYRLLGHMHDLEQHREARTELPMVLGRLRSLVIRDRGQIDRLARLESLVALDSARLSAEQARIEPGTAITLAGPELSADLARTEVIASAVDDLIVNERALLTVESAAADARYTAVLSSIGLGAVAGMALIGAILLVMRRDWRRLLRRGADRLAPPPESEQRFRQIFEESPLGILLAEQDGETIVQVNPAFRSMVGADDSRILGRSIADFVHVEDHDLLADAIRDDDAPAQGIEVRYAKPSGDIAWTSLRLAHLSGSHRRPGLMLALTEDITREKRVEAELRQAQKMEAIGQLTGGIAHDFNNLLGVIIGNVEFLLDPLSGVDQEELSREILRSALSGADLTRRLLAFSRRQTLQPRRIDLNAYLPNHIAILRRLLGEPITITTSLADGLWPTRADPSQIGDALLNLTINARHAMPFGGTLVIATANARFVQGAEMQGDYVVLSVGDTGTGMTPEVLERAVEPFFTTKGPGLGSGLGLSMVFGFAQQSGGHLHIDSKPDHGTMVSLYLPRAHGPDLSDPPEAAADPTPLGAEAILLVDDNEDMRAMARRILVSLGYRVSEASDGAAALALLRGDANLDMLLTDLAMPGGMSGHQLATAARILRPGLKVLFTTGYFRTEPDTPPEGPEAGMTIRKPYRRQDLASVVRGVLDTA